MSAKSMPMRVSEKTRRAINMIAAELQLETGDTISADNALWQFIEDHAPEIARRAVDIAESDSDVRTREGAR